MVSQVGSDSKALIDACAAAQKEHPTLPVILFSCDTGVLSVLPPGLSLLCIRSAFEMRKGKSDLTICCVQGEYWL